MTSFKPNACRFAVIRIDPVASVAHLNDSEATESAKALESKCYLVYVSVDRGLPFPGKPWYSFGVSPIARALRDVEEQYGCTLEMCMPIYPNEMHPTGRPALHTEPAFPYSGCYIWTFAETSVRVAPREEGWNPREAVLLPPIQRVKMKRMWGRDHAAADTAVKASRVATDEPMDAAEDDAYSSSGTDSSEAESADGPGGLGFCPPARKEAERIPVVELWYELTERLKDEDIPHPSEFHAEKARIISIIDAARERSAWLPDLDTSAFRPPESQRATMNKDIEEFVRQVQASNSKQKRFRPKKLLMKVKTRLRRWGSLPWLPVWH